MTTDFAIFGSCVSRDAFALGRMHDHETPSVAVYLARTTINSCLAPAVSLDALTAPAVCKFEGRCVHSDLGKTHFAELRAKAFDFLIVDLIDERHPVLKLGDSYVCHSVPLIRMATASGLDLSRFESLSPHDPRIVRETLDNIPRFVTALAEVVDPRRIVLHEAGWARRYIAADGAIRAFADQASIERCNRTLEQYYAAIRSACPALTSIRLSDRDLLADEKHRWTLEPFHYADRYHEEFMRRLDEVVGVPA